MEQAEHKGFKNITSSCLKSKKRCGTRHPKVEVVDLFCGIGGLSYGMKTAGFDILAGYDLDWTCQYAYENNLLYEFGRLVKKVHPDVVTMENVPAIAAFKLKSVLADFVRLLQDEKYQVSYQVVYCPDYGIPQTRKRLVLLASRLGAIQLISPTHQKNEYVTVRDTIGDLPPLKAGESCPTDPLHRCRALSELNLKRIQATPYGGGWKNWPKELLLDCHQKSSGRSFGSVYGRMVWDEPSPTMTTLCTGIGNGRFGHPDQDRAISAREAALFQTFPTTYKFFPNEQNVSLSKASRYIGNAVPPRLGEVIAESVKQHVRNVIE